MSLPSPQQKQIRVLLFGLGAIGSFYAFILSRCPNVDLTVVARSNHSKVKEEGLLLNSLNHGKHHVMFKHGLICRTPGEVTGTIDYVVCTNKAVDPDNIPRQFQHLTSLQTTFVVVQNGVGNEEYFQRQYPSNTILSCVIWVHSIQKSPNEVDHMKNEFTELGLHVNSTLPRHAEDARLHTFYDLLITGGTNVQIVEDIQVKRWQKCVWNIAWNPITMLTMVDTKTWLSRPEAMEMTKRLFREAISVGIASGVALRYELADELMHRISTMPGIYASMATDCKEGRPLELNVILGVPLRKARELNIDVPTLSTLFALTEAVHIRLSS